jgi:DNA-binding transcriptional LysR family regulator
VGARLLDRTKRSVRLTAAGEAFLKKAKLVLGQVEEAVDEARLADKGIVGVLRIGFVPSASLGFLPLTIRTFSQAYPRVDVTLLDLMTGEQIEYFAEGALDIGFVRLHAGAR